MLRAAGSSLMAMKTELLLAEELAKLPHADVPLSIDVVLEGDPRQEKHHAHPHEARYLAHPQGERPPHPALDGAAHAVPSAEHGDGQEVQEPKVDADERHRPHEIVGAPRPGLTGDIVDGDGSR